MNAPMFSGGDSLVQTRTSRTAASTALIEGARLGDALAMVELTRRWNGPLFRLAMNMLQDGSQAECAVRDTLTIMQREMKLLDSVDEFDRWIWALLSEQCLRRGEGIAWAQRHTEIEVPRMAGALACLESHDRLAYLLHDVEGLPLHDVSWILEEDVNDVLVRVRRARSQMQPTRTLRIRRLRRRTGSRR